MEDETHLDSESEEPWDERYAVPPSVSSSTAGDMIGRYKLLQKIGEGGFGVVYMAEQIEPIKRKVALKVIKLGMDTEQVVTRFEIERQALALMDHPNIAKVLDGGATEIGRPYFVMELVRGVAITTYCDKHRLTNDQRLELFITVCGAIQHAHQKGIIHRDIKPSNILVTLHDGVPVPKIIDFGVAKAIQQDLTDRTHFTRYEQLIGTPAFMSPEQAEMSGLDVDTRSDIYSLGALLYLLLTGKTPIDQELFTNTPPEVMRRRLREEEPQKPSQRLSSIENVEQSELAKHHGCRVNRLAGNIRTDLDWIVMKALEKDRTRRYETPAAFALDIRRYLNNEPVSAVAPSKWYSLWKMAERNRAAFVTSTLLLIAGVILLIAVSWGFVTATEATTKLKQQLRTNQAARAEIDRLLGDTERQAKELAYFAVSQANNAFEAKNWWNLSSIIEQCPPEWRHWEWNHINAFNPMGGILANPNEDSHAHAISPNGSLMALGNNWSDRISVWNLQTKKELWKDQGTVSWIYSEGSFSPDGSLVAFGLKGEDHGMVRIWRVESGQLIKELHLETSKASTTEFSPDSKLLAVGEGDDMVSFWSTISWKRQFNLTYATKDSEKPRGASIRFSPDGKRVAMLPRGLGTPDIKIWDLKSRKIIQRLQEGHSGGGVLNVAFFKHRNLLASSGTGGAVILWDLGKGKKVATFQHGLPQNNNYTRGVRALAISENERKIASGCGDGSIVVWDIADGAETDRFQSHDGFVQFLQFQSRDSKIVSAGLKGPVRQWHLETQPRSYTLPGYYGPVAELAFGSDETKSILAFVGGIDETVRTHDLNSGMTQLVLQQYESPSKVRFLGNDDQIAVFYRKGQALRIFDVNSGELLEEFYPESESPLGRIEINRDGQLMGAVIDGQRVGIWDVKAKKLIHQSEPQSTGVGAFCLSPDDKWIASCPFGDDNSLEQDLILESIHSPDESIRLPGNGRKFRSVTFSPDGTLLAAGFVGGIALWDLSQTNLTVRQLIKNTSSPSFTSLSFSPDGKRLASSDSKGGMTLWDTASGIEVESYPISRRGTRLTHVRFSPDGNTIATATKNGSITILESVYPGAIISEQRHYSAEATRIVNQLYRDLGMTDKVLESLNSNTSLDQPTKELAIQFSEIRREIPYELYGESWSIVKDREHGRPSYQDALKRIEKAIEKHPNRHPYQLTLGLALYRLGDYKQATEALERCSNLRNLQGIPEDSSLVDFYSIMAMASYQQEQAEEARQYAAKASDVLRKVGAHELPTLLTEAETLVNSSKE